MHIRSYEGVLALEAVNLKLVVINDLTTSFQQVA